MEARAGIEPACTDLQLAANPQKTATVPNFRRLFTPFSFNRLSP